MQLTAPSERPAGDPPKKKGYEPPMPPIAEETESIMSAEPMKEVTIDAGVLESFLTIMAEDHGAEAFDVLRAILTMAGSLKRLNAPRYSVINAKIRIDIEDGKVRFIGPQRDRRSYNDLKTQETTS